MGVKEAAFTLTSSAAIMATADLITREASSIAPPSTIPLLRSTSSTSRTRAGNSNPGVVWGQLAKIRALLGIADTRITIGEELTTSADPLIGSKEELKEVRASLSVIWGPPTALIIMDRGAMSTDPRLSAKCEAVAISYHDNVRRSDLEKYDL